MATTPEQIDRWRAERSEHQRLEFKSARSNFDTGKLYEYCVAIANEGDALVGRLCVELEFGSRSTRLKHLALVDSGSIRTVIPRRDLVDAGVELGPEVDRLNLRFGGFLENDVPVHLVDAVILSPDNSRWGDIELLQIPVDCCVTEDLPTLILGSSALLRLVVLLREHDQILHLKVWEHFAQAPHFTDDGF